MEMIVSGKPPDNGKNVWWCGMIGTLHIKMLIPYIYNIHLFYSVFDEIKLHHIWLY